ncbi:hypothetical protein BJ944DRAFT_271218 [Cunninghamella echinulata]|nr:hypothetical protein BJ944DRAFT_271218 [Cunninghamella echinulata]
MKTILLLLFSVFVALSLSAGIDQACYNKCLDDTCKGSILVDEETCKENDGPLICTPKCEVQEQCNNGRYGTSIGQACKCNDDCVGGGKSSCRNSVCCRNTGSYTNDLNECCSKDGAHVPISEGANYKCS